MGCLGNSTVFRLKNLIYWKNFYYINNYNYSYLIYNDINFIYFLESFFSLKISSKFNFIRFLFKYGLFFSTLKLTKILNKIYLLIYFSYLLIPNFFFLELKKINFKFKKIK